MLFADVCILLTFESLIIKLLLNLPLIKNIYIRLESLNCEITTTVQGECINLYLSAVLHIIQNRPDFGLENRTKVFYWSLG